MAFQIGQKVRIKSNSAAARVTGLGELVVIRLANEGNTICVKGQTSGARWVRADELIPVSAESTSGS